VRRVCPEAHSLSGAIRSPGRPPIGILDCRTRRRGQIQLGKGIRCEMQLVRPGKRWPGEPEMGLGGSVATVQGSVQFPPMAEGSVPLPPYLVSLRLDPKPVSTEPATIPPSSTCFDSRAGAQARRPTHRPPWSERFWPWAAMRSRAYAPGPDLARQIWAASPQAASSKDGREIGEVAPPRAGHVVRPGVRVRAPGHKAMIALSRKRSVGATSAENWITSSKKLRTTSDGVRPKFPAPIKGNATDDNLIYRVEQRLSRIQ
jgi:hypothetical protein